MQVVTPPTRSLGVHALPANTHNGDVVNIDQVGASTPAGLRAVAYYVHCASQQAICISSNC